VVSRAGAPQSTASGKPEVVVNGKRAFTVDVRALPSAAALQVAGETRLAKIPKTTIAYPGAAGRRRRLRG
jgi:hypothetical protein